MKAQSRRDEEREEKNDESNQSATTTDSTLNGHRGSWADKRKCRLTGTTQSGKIISILWLQFLSLVIGPRERFIFLISINKCNNWDAIPNYVFTLTKTKM